LICEIYDTGIGIPADQMKYLFTAFQDDTQKVTFDRSGHQINTFTGATHGAGLGLSATKILANAQGGSVDIESEIGDFTKVTLSVRVETSLLLTKIETNEQALLR
jgi:signal transduction histidine kinase